MLDKGYLTPSELAKISGKSVQNISSKYIPKLVLINAIRYKNSEGRNKYYEVTPEIKWWKLQRSEKQKTDSKIKTQTKVKKIIDGSLKDFF